jgi:N-acetylglucosaminyldiphosphoundecaprenol N-acetyl-beta-D-mannosaminyltransferase
VIAGQGDAAPTVEFPRVRVLGVEVSAISMSDALAAIGRWIATGAREYVCVVPAHTVMDCQDDPRLLEIVNGSGLVTPDGMSLVWLIRLRGHRHVERVYGPDLLLAACRLSVDGGWRHYFIGGGSGVAAELAVRLQRRFPGLLVSGTEAPPFGETSPEADEAIVRRINDAHPDIVWVGLGSPKQERWMASHRERLRAAVLIGVGAAFDFLTGRRRQAPRWVQRAGLEWLFRLLCEPRRLWRRYARYPRFLGLVAAESVGWGRNK